VPINRTIYSDKVHFAFRLLLLLLSVHVCFRCWLAAVHAQVRHILVSVTTSILVIVLESSLLE
jgi:hypothetical protein